MTVTAEEFDWSDVDDSKAELRETNVMPRTGTTRTGARRGRPRSTKRFDNLQKSLSQQMFQAGAIIGFGLPVTGYYIAQESDSYVSAILQLAAKKPEWLEALEKVADIGPGITVGRTTLGIVAAMGADRFHRTEGQAGFSPDRRALQFLGVSAAYQAVHGDEDNASPDSYAEPPHGTFVPVA